MAEGFNKAILIGNLGTRPELKATQSGRSMLRLRLATNETYVDKEGTKQERTDWHTVVVWGKRAEGLARILDKGDSLGVEGRIRHRQWEGTDGKKRSSAEVEALDVVLLGRARGSAGSSDPVPLRSRNGNGLGSGAADDVSEGDIPF
jgi:single-strand DNA-binding protein